MAKSNPITHLSDQSVWLERLVTHEFADIYQTRLVAPVIFCVFYQTLRAFYQSRLQNVYLFFSSDTMPFMTTSQPKLKHIDFQALHTVHFFKNLY